MNSKNSMSKKINRRSFLQVVGVAGIAGACWKMGFFGSPDKLQVARRSQPIMGTTLNITLYGPDRDRCEEAISQTISSMETLETILSRHREDSELARLNSSGHLDRPSKDLLEVLSLAADINKKSSGSFDPTILPLLRERENGDRSFAANNPVHPIGFDKLNIDDNRVELKVGAGRMELSLDGIAKGYIVDQGVTVLKGLGFNNQIIDAGGDLMVSGVKDKKQPWQIGIRNPRPGNGQKMTTLPVSDKAVATSGDYMQPFTKDFRQHHIIDPASINSPLELASCTVTAPDVATADGLATAVMVLGKDDGLELLESIHGCEGLLITKTGGIINQYNSTGFFS